MTPLEALRVVAPPLIAVAVLIGAMLARAGRERRERPAWPPPGRAAATIAGGSALFLGYVWVFQVVLGGDGPALREAVSGGGALLAIALAGFAALSAIERLRR